MGFLGADHLNIVADLATHSRHDTMASIVWSWQTGVAAHGDLQYIPHGGMLSSEQEMPEHIARLYCERRLERLAAFPAKPGFGQHDQAARNVERYR